MKVRVSQVTMRGSRESVRDSIRGLRKVEVGKQLKMRKISFLKLPPTSLRNRSVPRSVRVDSAARE